MQDAVWHQDGKPGNNRKGYISGRGNPERLDSAYLSAYLTRRNSQTSQIGPEERLTMYAMQLARAVEVLKVLHAQEKVLRAQDESPTCSRRVQDV